jgi:hypothetical protein
MIATLLMAVALAMVPQAATPPAAAPPAAAAPFEGTRDLAWMSGHWETPSDFPAGGPRWTEEYWTEPGIGIMLGLRRAQRGFGQMTFDYMRIVEETDGLAFYGSPQGAPAVRFRMVSGSRSAVTFENPRRSYPQRIAYRLDGDSMVATISRLDGSQAQSWRYHRDASHGDPTGPEEAPR